MKKWNKEKRYVIYKVSEDGLLKMPASGFYDEPAFKPRGYSTEEEAWDAIEKYAGDPNAKYAYRFEFVVLTVYAVTVQEIENE